MVSIPRDSLNVIGPINIPQGPPKHGKCSQTQFSNGKKIRLVQETSYCPGPDSDPS